MSALSPTVSASPVELLLARLDGVRAIGAGRWIAKCPAHADNRPSLAIAEGADGRVLLHCHAGDGVHAILGAVGLEARDLFPQRSRDLNPAERNELRMYAQMAGWAAALGVLEREVRIIIIIAAEVLAGCELNTDDYARAELALQRIEDARVALTP